jgi:hypothetical protein
MIMYFKSFFPTALRIIVCLCLKVCLFASVLMLLFNFCALCVLLVCVNVCLSVIQFVEKRWGGAVLVLPTSASVARRLPLRARC